MTDKSISLDTIIRAGLSPRFSIPEEQFPEEISVLETSEPVSIKEFMEVISPKEIAAAERLVPIYRERAEEQEKSVSAIYRSFRKGILANAKEKNIDLKPGQLAAMFRAAVSTREPDPRALVDSVEHAVHMRMVVSGDTGYLLFQSNAGVEIVAQTSGDRDALNDELKFLWYLDIFAEVILGILTLAGARVKAGSNTGKAFKELLKREKVKRALLLLLEGGLTFAAFVDFITAVMEEKGLVDILMSFLDCSFWAILFALAAFAAKLTPGVGQAATAAAIGILGGQLVVKVVKGPDTV